MEACDSFWYFECKAAYSKYRNATELCSMKYLFLKMKIHLLEMIEYGGNIQLFVVFVC